MHSIIHLPSPRPRSDSSTNTSPDISDRGEIADHPGKAHLRAATIINAKAQRMLDRPGDHVARNSLSPIAIRQELVDDVQIESRGIGADEKLAATVLDDHVGIHPWLQTASSLF